MNLRKHKQYKSIEQKILELPRDETYFTKLEDIQSECEHIYIRDGSDSHHEYHKCIKCHKLITV